MESETASISLRGEGQPYCEKLVWQGSFAGANVRVRIVQSMKDAPIETVVERFCVCADRVERWLEYMAWHEPGTDTRPAVSLFVEGIIDLLGRPDWDTRAKVASTYPLWLKVGREW
jgi:hypothetical protein